MYVNLFYFVVYSVISLHEQDRNGSENEKQRFWQAEKNYTYTITEVKQRYVNTLVFYWWLAAKMLCSQSTSACLKHTQTAFLTVSVDCESETTSRLWSPTCASGTVGRAAVSMATAAIKQKRKEKKDVKTGEMFLSC